MSRLNFVGLQKRAVFNAKHLWRDSAFQLGMREQSTASLGVAAWALVTGIAMVKSGLSAPLAILMSLLVYAGSSQLATLPLLAVGSPLWVIWLTGICVNLRFVIFSSFWREHLGHLPRFKRVFMAYISTDLLFVLFSRRYAGKAPSKAQENYYWGSALVAWFSWQIPCVAGVFLAQVVPLSWGLGFAGMLALLAVALTLLVDKATLLSTIVAGAAAIAAFSLPLRLNILVAIAAAIALGLLFESAEKALKRNAMKKNASANYRQGDEGGTDDRS